MDLTRRATIVSGLAFATGAHAAGLNNRSGRIVTVVGSGVQGVAQNGDAALNTRLDQPYGVCIGPDGALYWADFGSNRVLKMKSGRVSAVAGNTIKGHAGDGEKAVAAQLNAPHEVRFDSHRNMLVAERDANVIRRIDARTRLISTFAGTGEAGFGGDGGPATNALLKQPHSIALDRHDNLFICDIQNNRIRRRDARTGILTTFAGNGDVSDTPSIAPLSAALHGPRSIDSAPDGTMYLILREGNKVFAIDPRKQTLSRIAGTGARGYGGDGGRAKDATWNGPKGIAYAPDGSLYVSDTENHVIRRISLRNGTVSTVVGTGQRGDGPDGNPLKCALARPHGLFVHGGLLYIGDSENHRIRALAI